MTWHSFSVRRRTQQIFHFWDKSSLFGVGTHGPFARQDSYQLANTTTRSLRAMFGICRVSPRARSWSELATGSVRPRASSCSCGVVRRSSDNTRNREFSRGISRQEIQSGAFWILFELLRAEGDQNLITGLLCLLWFWGKCCWSSAGQRVISAMPRYSVRSQRP